LINHAVFPSERESSDSHREIE